MNRRNPLREKVLYQLGPANIIIDKIERGHIKGAYKIYSKNENTLFKFPYDLHEHSPKLYRFFLDGVRKKIGTKQAKGIEKRAEEWDRIKKAKAEIEKLEKRLGHPSRPSIEHLQRQITR